MAEAVENTEARGDHPPTRGAPGGPPLQVQSAIFVLAVPKWLAVSSMRSIRSQRFKPMFVCLVGNPRLCFWMRQVCKSDKTSTQAITVIRNRSQKPFLV